MPVPTTRCWARSRARRARRRVAPLDRRPYRRHQGVRAGLAGVGHVARARSRRRARARRGLGAGARHTVVGTTRWRHVAQRRARAGVTGGAGRRRAARVLVGHRVRGRGHRRRVPRARRVAAGAPGVSATSGATSSSRTARSTSPPRSAASTSGTSRRCCPIVEEAGGRISDITGAVRADGGNVVATNGLLHDEVLRFLG